MAKKKLKSKKITSQQSKQEAVDKLDKDIEDLELHDMSETEIEKTVSAFSAEGLELRRARKKVRYQLYRLRTESEGKCASESDDEFRKKFEDQPLFDGWRMFGTTWDVAMDDPYRIVHKTISEQEEWNEVVRSKFPQIEAGGKIVYPDINVRKKVEKEAESRKKK